MNESQPSRTCLYTAAGRALGARDADPAVRNPDYLAERLLGPEERALISEQLCVQALDDPALANNMEALSAALMMQVRTRFIEERLADAVARGVKQLVLLGAGFDTRAYRLTDLLREVRVFEVDQPSTQGYKRRRIAEAGIEVPANLTYVPVDFRRDDLGTMLGAAGYDSAQPTFFIWEGVTMYLPEAAIEQTLRWVAGQAPGGVIVFDYVYRNVIEMMAKMAGMEIPEPARAAVERVRKLVQDEPWLFGIPGGEEAAYLQKLGLELTKLLPIGGEESRKRYLIRSDGSFYVPLPPGMTRPPTGAGGNAPYSLAEAVIPSGKDRVDG